MTQKKTSDKRTDIDEDAADIDAAPPARVLTSKQEVLDELKMGVTMFNSLLAKYPFRVSGVSGKLNNRWHVAVEDVWRWYHYVQQQEIRHPDARRMRPVEPPEIATIRGR